MFHTTADRLASQPLRSEPGRFRESDALQGSVQELPAHVPRDGSSMLFYSNPYSSAYAQPDQYFSGAQHASTGRAAVPRTRAYLDANTASVVHGSFASMGHAMHNRYADALQPANSTDEITYSSQLTQPLAPLTREDMSGNLDITTLIPHYSSDPASTTTPSTSTHSSPTESDTWRIAPQEPGTEPAPRPRKPRREKPRIELAPDQPPTTQGKPRARVYVACIQCRTRKIRCDGAKPVCHNCGRRANGGGECTYDAAPKRRGPDKTPGARQRMARDVRSEIEGNIGPTRRQRRRRDDDSIKSEPPPASLSSGSLPDTMRYAGQQVPSSWPLCMSPISHISADNFRATQEFSVQAAGQHSSKLTLSGDCGCSVPSPYGHDFSERADSVYISRAIPQDYDPYAQGFDPTPTPTAYIEAVPSGFPLADNDRERESSTSLPLLSEPSAEFSKRIWWDSLLCLYSSLYPHHNGLSISSQRDTVSRSIKEDLRFLFKNSNYWFSFLHVPTFFATFFDPEKRKFMQPSLVFAALAISTFWQSSEAGDGRAGRERALKFRDEAQGALEASLNAKWVDEALAQAAWLLALFEVCAHPLHSTQRSTSALVLLDSLIRSLSLTYVDADNQSISVFLPRSVPTIPSAVEKNPIPVEWPTPSNSRDSAAFSAESPSNSLLLHPSCQSVGDSQLSIPQGCCCKALSLGESDPCVLDHTPLWVAAPAWDKSWSDAEIRKESCRRLCWSSAMLAAGHISHATANKSPGLDLFITDPANYALLLSGESLSGGMPGTCSPKDTVWALYDRSMLLWHSCARMRHDRIASDTEKAHFAMTAWLEADAIEAALNTHTCDLERAFIFIGRELLFNTRMCISHEFQRFIPLMTADVSRLFHRKKAEEWLTHQSNMAKRFMAGLHTVTGLASNLLARRPFFLFWFMAQISRALSLWDCDHSLTLALDLCRALLAPIEYLTALWPCSEQRRRYEILRERLANACFIAGQPPIPPLNLISPASSLII